MHESATNQTQHVGHHEHNHDVKSKVGQANDTGQSSNQFDVDCWVCHGAGIGALSLVDAKQGSSREGLVGIQPNKQLTGLTPAPPDRPQWSDLA